MRESIIRFAICFSAALLFSPLLGGIINKVKAFFAGRHGPRLCQGYYDLWKLIKKESIISSSSGGLFIRLLPPVLLGFTLMAGMLLPCGMTASPLGFPGDSIMFLYLFGSCRLISVLAALDTGSSFEGMGSARELFFSALSEAALFGVLAYLALFSHSFSLGEMLCTCGMDSWISFTPVLLAVISLFLAMLAENCRVPFDDPETHLELTMIHEAMILDYSGFDLAAIFYASWLKLWLFCSFTVTLLIPSGIFPLWAELLLYFAGIFVLAVLIGTVESSMARYRFKKVPPLLLAATVLPVLAILFLIFFEGGLK